MCAENCSICNASRLAAPRFPFPCRSIDRSRRRPCGPFWPFVIETLPKSPKPKTIETNFPHFHVSTLPKHARALAFFQFSNVFFSLLYGRFVIWRLACCSALFIDAFCHLILCRTWSYINYICRLHSTRSTDQLNWNWGNRLGLDLSNIS